MKIRIATRKSELALWQANHVAGKLVELAQVSDVTLVPLSTRGDEILDRSLQKIGGKGLFIKELEVAMQAGEADIAVHSMKDVPAEMPDGFCIATVLERASPADALVSAREGGLASLPGGARVGTSSPRRRAQILAFRDDLVVEPVRGNVETRVSKAVDGPLDAVVLAAAGLNRLGLTEHVREVLPIETFLPAPGQGALAVQCREDDQQARALLALIDDPEVRAEVDAERAFLSALGGGCSLPVGALARHVEGAPLELHGFVGALNGGESIRVSSVGEDPLELGRALAEEAFSLGARELLA